MTPWPIGAYAGVLFIQLKDLAVHALITGATGMIGRSLTNRFEQVTMTTRQRSKISTPPNVTRVIEWDPMAGPFEEPNLPQVDVVINLMGASIAQRWSAKAKLAIHQSRVLGTRNLVDSIRKWRSPPSVFVSGSAVGFYGDHGECWLDETSEPGSGFLAGLCQEWEAEAIRLADPTRVVLLRTGLVLSPNGGMLRQLLPLYRWGLGGVVGSGRQWMPWIHLTDLIRMIDWAVQSPALSGPMNATAPCPVTGREFNAALAGAVRRPAWFWVPASLLQFGLGELATAILSSQRVRPAVAIANGFQFQHPELNSALNDLLRISEE